MSRTKDGRRRASKGAHFRHGLLGLVGWLVFSPAAADTHRVPSQFSRIDAALAAAASGDTIQVVGNGGATYYERLRIDKDIMIEGGWRADYQVRDPDIYVSVLRDTSSVPVRPIVRIEGPNRVVLDGLHLWGGQFGVEAESGADVTVRGCTIRGQRNGIEGGPIGSKVGGGIRMLTGSLLLESSVIRDVTAAFAGAGLGLVNLAQVVIRDSRIFDTNSLPFLFDLPGEVPGGALYVVSAANLLIERTELVECNAFLDGGLAYIKDTSVRVAGSTLSGSRRARAGGAIFFEECPSVVVEGSLFEACEAATGGALYAKRCGSLSIEGTRFSRNGSPGEGGAVFVESTPFSIVGSRFTANHLTFSEEPPVGGGAVRSLASDGMVVSTAFDSERVSGHGGAWSQAGGIVDFEGCFFEGNEATLAGGALHISVGGEIRLRECLGFRNRALYGGAVAASFTGRIDLEKCTLADNVARSNGAAVHVDTAARIRVKDSIVCCSERGDLIHCASGSIQVSYSDLWNDDSENHRSEFGGLCSDPFADATNLRQNPMFCDGNGGDYALAPTSPCVGAASDGTNLGAAPVGCPAAPVAVEGESWARIKSHYRSSAR